MTIAETSIRNPVFAWMLMISLMFFGWLGFSRLGISQMPDVDFPMISVAIDFEGASPEIMETEVVDILEDTIMSIAAVKGVTSSARQGSASVSIEFELERDIDAAFQEVQNKVAQAQRRLPDGIDPPVITKVNPEDNPIMWVALSGKEKSVRELVDYAQDHVKPYLQTVSGVGDVFLGGFLERNLRVWVDASKLTAHELTLGDVIQSIREQHAETPAGRIETSAKEFNLRVMGEARNPEEFGKILITHRGGQPIYTPIALKEVAKIEDGVADVRRKARVNGQPAIGMGILKQRGSNAVAVGEAVRKRLEEMKQVLAPGFELGVNFDSTRFVKESIRELNFTLILSALLTSLVCWLFLGSFGATLNVLLAIPTSILGTFLVLYFFGFTLNTFTLLGLTLAIGIVVDDAIMVLENITRHGESGKSRFKAALDGSKEITFAALAATIAVIAIFLPVAFMKGIVGRFFYQFGVTISVAVALSLLEALTLTPMRCSRYLTVGEHKGRVARISEAVFSRLLNGYRHTLALSLRWKWSTIFASAVLFSGSLLMIQHIRKEFVPPQDQSMFMVRMQAPIGSSIQYTDDKFLKAESFLRSRSEVTRYFGAVGGFGGGEVDTGVLFVSLTDRKERELTQAQMIDLTRKELNAIGGIKAFVQDLSISGFASSERGYPVEFSLRGPDWESLGKYGETIRQEMAKEGLFEDIDTDYRVGMPEIRVVPDRARAADRGVSIEAIGATVAAAMGGVREGRYTHQGRRYDVRVRLVAEDRMKAADISGLLVRNNRGEIVPLRDVSTVEERISVQTIRRRDRERAVGIFANLKKGVSQAEALDKAKTIADRVIPSGYRSVFTGSAKTFRESGESLLFALWIGIAVSYMVLASQYNSFLHPLIILLALPFSITGGLLALLFTGQSINVFSLIGILLLMGIVKKNSILLVDFTNQLRREGKPAREALLEACPVRLRPILMTSITTIVAAVPAALSFGPGAETRTPMAWAVIGGVTVSTLLTLFVVPCAYEATLGLERYKTHSPEATVQSVNSEISEAVHPTV